MGYLPDPNNPGWLLLEGADPAQESSWWQIPEGFVADPSNPGWYYREGADVAQQENWAHDPSIADPEPQRTGIVRGIDVASYQPADLSGLVAKAQASHVVVRMYQRTVEGSQLQAHSRQQVVSAVANGCTVSTPYMWLYNSAPVDRQINEAIDLAESCGIGLKILWLDIEPYTDGSLPSVAQIQAALDACSARGVQGGIYTGEWVWARLGYPRNFSGYPLWHAAYDHVPALKPVNYGGWTMPVGWQYDDKLPSGEALDMDVFDASVI